jgi:hypothetical protein
MKAIQRPFGAGLVPLSTGADNISDVGNATGSAVGVSEIWGAALGVVVQAANRQSPNMPTKSPLEIDIRLIAFLQSAQIQVCPKF